MSENLYFFSARFKYSQSNELRTKLYALATNTNPVIKYTSNNITQQGTGCRVTNEYVMLLPPNFSIGHLCVMHIFYEKFIKKNKIM